MALHKPFWSLALNGSFPCSSQAVVVVDDACYREPASMAELCMGWRLPLQQVDTSVACGASGNTTRARPPALGDRFFCSSQAWVTTQHTAGTATLGTHRQECCRLEHASSPALRTEMQGCCRLVESPCSSQAVGLLAA